MTIGDRIRAARLKKGYTQEELAALLGYKSRSSVNKMEVDGRDIPRSMVVKLATLLNVTPSYLMGWDELDIQNNDTSDQGISAFKELFNKYNSLDEYGKRRVEDFIEREYTRCNIKSEFAAARSSTRNFMPVPTDEQIAMMDEVTPDMLGE